VDLPTNHTNEKHTLKLLNINCRSLRSLSKRNQLASILSYYDIDIIFGCESHIDQSFLSAEILPTTYKIIRKDRSLGGGGVFIGFKNYLELSEVTTLSSNISDTEMVWGKLQIHNQKPLHICSFYRPPDTSLSPIIELNNCLLQLHTSDPENFPHLLIAGDFNFPDISWCNGYAQIDPNPAYGTGINQLFVDSINDYGLEQFINIPTRGNNILDLLLCSHPNLISNIKIAPGISDHDAILYSLDLHSRPLIDRIDHPIYLYYKGNLEGLKVDISNFQTQFLTSDPYSNELESNWQNFKHALSDAITTHIPQRLIKSTNKLPWLTPSTKRLMNRRTHLYNKAKSLQTVNAWNDYRTIRNKITHDIRNAHTKYQTNLFNKNGKTNHKNFWKYIKNIRKDQLSIPPLNHDGNTITSSNEKANILNSKFQSVFTCENTTDIPSCNGTPYPTMPDVVISCHGVQNLLESLDPNKASGPDNIPTRILKLCAKEIAPILTVIFIQSLTSGHIPNDWLKANITPVFKKGDKSDANNYRPISLTAVCCKILEHILYHHITEHLNTYNVLINQQFGFRAGHSCEAQLISVVEDIQMAMDSSHQVDIIFIDFRKAFDTVPHHRLLNKLSHYGIQGRTHNWLRVWLTQRIQRVVINGYESDFVKVQSGVPQGTVLGPLMFLLYINDINLNITSQLRLFADDCILYRIINSQHDHLELQNDLNLIVKWTQTWQMGLNTSKCVILTCSRLLSPSASVYTIDDHSLMRVTEHLYLGILFDSKMSFSPHINSITSKATRMLNFVKRNLYRCSRDTKCMAYTSLVRPLLEYGSAVWDPYLQKDTWNIEMVQRRAARWVESDYGYNSSVSSMLSNLQWPTLQHRRYITRLKLLYNMIHDSSAIKIPNYFTSTNYPTRRNHPLRYETPFAKSNHYKFSYFPKSINDWNQLSIETIESPSLQLFIERLS